MKFSNIQIQLLLLFNLCLCIQTIHLKSQSNLPRFDVMIIGTNDIHGTVYPTVLSRKDTKQTFKYGGLVYMANIIQTLRQQYKGNILYLDAGDQFQGGVQASSKVSSGQIVSDYFNHINLNASAVGNHQFDFGPKFLENYLSKLNNDILDANLIDTKDNSLPLKNQKKSKLYRFPIKNPQFYNTPIHPNLTQIKIGVIGLSTLQTIKTTSGFLDKLFPESYKFLQYKGVIQEQARKLKNQGAHAIIIVSHIGNDCDKSTQYGFWTIKNQAKQIPCQRSDQIFKMIDSLPEGLIDAVVQGHRHVESHYFYKGVPIIGTINGGYYLNTIRLRFTLDQQKVFIDKDEIYMEGPIPVCERIFEGTRRCDYIPSKQLPNAGRLIQWEFHGKKVQADQDLDRIFKQKYDKIMKPFETQLAMNYIETPLVKDRAQDSYLGNLMTKIMSNAVKKGYKKDLDFMILNGGGFRSAWFPGVIRKAQLYSMFPFDGFVVTFKILGSHLKKLIQKVQNGRARYYPTWGLQQIFSIDQAKSRSQHLIRHKHLLSHQKLQHERQYLRLQKLISTLDKKPIQDDKYYIGATNDFVINGGDDFFEVVKPNSQIKFLQIKNHQVQYKNLIEQELKAMKQLNDADMVGPNGMKRFIIKGQNEQQQRIHQFQVQTAQFF